MTFKTLNFSLKHNLMKNISTGIFTSALLFSFLITFNSCKSTQISEAEKINPLALLSEDSSIYINVPVSNHIDLTSEILCAEIESLDKKDAKLLAERISNLYVGLGTVKDRSRLQVSGSVDVPQIAVKKILSKKNGWNKNLIKIEKTNPESEYEDNFEIYSRSDMAFKLSFPSSDIITVASDLNSLLQKYADASEVTFTPYNNWINQKNDNILFYITKPGQYLRSMIGISAKGIDAVYGELIYAPDAKNPKQYSGKYELKLNLHLTDKKAMFAFTSLLSLSFGMMGGEVKSVDDLTLELSGIEVDLAQIKDLFTRDPITGKHFRVEGDSIIQEKKIKK